MNIAIVAHETKKDLLITFVIENEAILGCHELVATADTAAEMLAVAPHLRVTTVLPAHLGGGAQIASLVATRRLELVLLLRDALDNAPQETDMRMLMRLCDVHDIPLATNRSTATLLLRGGQPSGTWKRQTVRSFSAEPS